MVTMSFSFSSFSSSFTCNFFLFSCMYNCLFSHYFLFQLLVRHWSCCIPYNLYLLLIGFWFIFIKTLLILIIPTSSVDLLYYMIMWLLYIYCKKNKHVFWFIGIVLVWQVTILDNPLRFRSPFPSEDYARKDPPSWRVVRIPQLHQPAPQVHQHEPIPQQDGEGGDAAAARVAHVADSAEVFRSRQIGCSTTGSTRLRITEFYFLFFFVCLCESVFVQDVEKMRAFAV